MVFTKQITGLGQVNSQSNPGLRRRRGVNARMVRFADGSQ